MARVRTRKQSEKDVADVRQGLLLLAALAALWAWAASKSVLLAVLAFFLAVAAIELLVLAPGMLRRRRLRSLGYDKVYSMNGEQFEEYLQALFQGKGYQAALTANGADFGADLILGRDRTRTVVQAKHWVNNDVGIGAVQEVYAAKAYYKADQAMVVTVAPFTKQAIELAMACNVEVWDGERLQKEVLALNSTQHSPKRHFLPANVSQVCPASQSPFCPSCGRPMVRRTSQYGEFWGCSGYPACRGTLALTT